MAGSGRTRVVSFRLSEAEYQHLLDISNANGARTVSEITRQVMTNLIDSGSDYPEPLEKRIMRLDRTVFILNDEVRKLAAVIQSALPANAESAESPTGGSSDE